MTKTSSIIAAAAAWPLVVSMSGAAQADTLDEACQALDRSRETRCALERPRADEWVLRTA